MASTDAKLVPTKNVAYRVTFPILDADGDLVTGAIGLDSEVSKDAGTFTDCTNEATEIATSSGMYYLDLTSTEMNADTVAVIVKTSSSGAKTTVLTFYPQEAGDLIAAVGAGGITATSFSDDALVRLGIIAYGTAQAATGTTLQLASASTFANDEVIGSIILITGGTTGVGQSRVITGYVSSTDTATVDTWTTTPTGTITYVVFAAPPASATALPTVLLSSGTGTGQISLSSGTVTTGALSAGVITAAAIATGAIDADALATDAVTEIAAGVLSAAAADPIDANVEQINTVAITGNGSVIPFGV